MEKTDKKLNIKLEFEGFEIAYSQGILSNFGSLSFKREEGYQLYINQEAGEKKLSMFIHDNNCDGKVESIYFVSKSSYKRGQKGTEKIFEKADEILARHMEELKVSEVRKEWEEKLGKYNTKEEYYSDVIKDL